MINEENCINIAIDKMFTDITDFHDQITKIEKMMLTSSSLKYIEKNKEWRELLHLLSIELHYAKYRIDKSFLRSKIYT